MIISQYILIKVQKTVNGEVVTAPEGVRGFWKLQPFLVLSLLL